MPEASGGGLNFDMESLVKAAIMKHVFDCLKMFSGDGDNPDEDYWAEDLFTEEDGVVTVTLKLPMRDVYFWWLANGKIAVEQFMSPKQMQKLIEDKADV